MLERATRACVIAVASTHLDALEGSIAPEEALLDDEVAHHDLGQPAEHAAGNAEAVRAGYADSTGTAISDRAWTVDGDVAFVDYAVGSRTTTSSTAPRGSRSATG